MKKYIALNIILPLIILIVLPIFLFILSIKYFSISEINLPFVTLALNTNTTIPNYISHIFVFTILLAFFVGIFIAIRKFNKDRVFLNGDIYGINYYIFYKIAYLLGFRKICLMRKPYYIIFKIVMDGKFELINLNEEHSELSNDISITVDESDFHYINNLRECNLIISDTYPINKSQIPLTKQNIDTIIVSRIGNTSIRISSQKLVNKTREEIVKILYTGAKINLYMTTSTYNTFRIIEEGFMQAKRGKLNIEIFQQDTKDINKKFKEKGKWVVKEN